MHAPRTARCLQHAARHACGALLLGAAAATAQTAQQVEILGTRAPPSDADSAAPLTIWRAADLARAGVSTARQALAFVAANQAADGVAQAVGEATGGIAEADLRGLGPDNTLVLLNGRRIANHAYESGTADLNAIPFAALDRIEVRRSGAGALYGSGAVAGVIDFILRSSVQGLDLSAQAEAPRQHGGAMQRATLSGGTGQVERDGFNAFVVLDVRRQSAIAAQDRSFARSGVVRAADGTLRQARLSDTSFPGDLDGFEPSLASGCAPPRSLPDPAGASACRYDSAADVDLLPANRQAMLFARGVFEPAPGQRLAVEALHADHRVRSHNAPTPLTQVLPESSPYWLAGRPAEEISGAGPGGIVDWRAVPAGLRSNESRSRNTRWLASAEGEAGPGLTYSAALVRSASRASDRLVAGHLDEASIQQGLIDGRINPFGGPDATGAALQAAAVRGPISNARGEVTLLDARVGSAPGQPFGASVSVEWRRENFRFDLMPAAQRVADTGLNFAQDTAGVRRATAVFGQLDWRPDNSLRLELALRHERTSDGAAMTSPLAAARWQLAPALALRATAGRSFRLPTLYETREPLRLARTGDSFNDPLLCPGGQPAEGVDEDRACERSFLHRTGGPASYGRPADSLAPERARHATVGLVFEPLRQLALSLDLWRVRLKGRIDALSPERVMADTALQATHLVRCRQLGATAGTVADCVGREGSDEIAFIDTPLANLGRIESQGLDLGGQLRSGLGAAGEFSLAFNGSYIAHHRRELDSTGAAQDIAGRYADDQALPRWQHAWQAGWSRAAWSATLAQRRISGYRDAQDTRRVAPWSVLDLSGACELSASTSVEVGLKNLLDRRPPFSNQADTPQANYDPRLADPQGRALSLRISHRFP